MKLKPFFFFNEVKLYLYAGVCSVYAQHSSKTIRPLHSLMYSKACVLNICKIYTRNRVYCCVIILGIVCVRLRVCKPIITFLYTLHYTTHCTYTLNNHFHLHELRRNIIFFNDTSLLYMCAVRRVYYTRLAYRQCISVCLFFFFFFLLGHC